jgi:hypothetical protein
MTQIQILLVGWVCLTVLAVGSGNVACIVKKQPFKPQELAEFMNLSLATAAVVSSISLIYRAITIRQLEDLLGFDLVTLYLGAIAVIWLSVQQVWQIFK